MTGPLRRMPEALKRIAIVLTVLIKVLPPWDTPKRGVLQEPVYVTQ